MSRMAVVGEIQGMNRCGTYSGGGLDTAAHPDVAPNVSREELVCFPMMVMSPSSSANNGNYVPCRKLTLIKLQKCGNFFVYKLPNAPDMLSRYCGAS